MIVPLSDAQLKAIQNHYPRSQAEINQDVAIIRHWLDKQPHLPKTSDIMIKKILFSLKYRTEKTKLVIENYYTVRETFPQIYEDLDPTTTTFREHVEKVHMFPLPKLTPEFSRVLCYRVMTKDAKSLCTDFQLKRNELMWNWLFEQDALSLNNVWIFDLKYMDSMVMWSHCNMSFMKKLFKISLDAKPVRINKVHFINVSPVAETTLNFIRQFFPQKFKDRFIFHNTPEALHEYYPTEILPNELGGKAGTMEELNDKMHDELVKRKSWCIEMESLKADSSRRIGELKTADLSILGIEGNFKKLDID